MSSSRSDMAPTLPGQQPLTADGVTRLRLGARTLLLRIDQVAKHDITIPRVKQLRAGQHREHRFGRLLALLARHRVEHPALSEVECAVGPVVAQFVRVDARPGFNLDLVPLAQFEEVTERLTVSHAVGRDREVPDLACCGTLLIPADPRSQRLVIEAGHDRHLVILAEPFDSQKPDCVAVDAVIPVGDQLLGYLLVLLLGDDVRAEVLPADVAQEAQPGEDADGTNERDEPCERAPGGPTFVHADYYFTTAPIRTKNNP